MHLSNNQKPCPPRSFCETSKGPKTLPHFLVWSLIAKLTDKKLLVSNPNSPAVRRSLRRLRLTTVWDDSYRTTKALEANFLLSIGTVDYTSRARVEEPANHGKSVILWYFNPVQILSEFQSVLAVELVYSTRRAFVAAFLGRLNLSITVEEAWNTDNSVKQTSTCPSLGPSRGLRGLAARG